jgi:hypothetical protein
MGSLVVRIVLLLVLTSVVWSLSGVIAGCSPKTDEATATRPAEAEAGRLTEEPQERQGPVRQKLAEQPVPPSSGTPEVPRASQLPEPSRPKSIPDEPPRQTPATPSDSAAGDTETETAIEFGEHVTDPDMPADLRAHIERSLEQIEPPKERSPAAPRQGTNALAAASFEGEVERVRGLLDEGVDPSGRDDSGLPPVIYASIGTHPEVLDLLLSRGADIDDTDEGGRTILHHVEDPVIIRLALERGADPNIQDENGATALMVAALNGDNEKIVLLLENGADQSLRDAEGVTALEFAQESGFINTIALLENAETFQ